MPDLTPHESEEPQRDFGKMFDLDRSTLIKTFVDRMEQAMREQEVAADDLKQILAECKEAEIPRKDITAMKAVAKLRLKDKVADAREGLEALEHISRLVGLPLFTWADGSAKR